MNIASIDIGSNTVLLLIAKVQNGSEDIDTILNKYEAPRLGRGLKDDGNISDESIDKLIRVLNNYSKLISEYNCDKIICTATNAMRVAKNSEYILSKVKQEIKIDINIISGDREAELSFLGAAAALPNSNEKIVMDIGGGSTEIIYGSNKNIIFKKSFPVGAVNLTEKFIMNDIPTVKETETLSEYIRQTFSELKSVIPSNTPLIAVAGTPTSLSAINLGLAEYDDKLVEGSSLNRTKIEEFIKYFSDHSPMEILNNYGKMLSGREDVILAGTLILWNVASITKNDKVFVSGRGIRYGSVIDYIDNSLNG